MNARLVIYGRPGCHLCDEAELRIRELVPDEPIELIDIEADEALLRLHLERIPVIVVDGVEIGTLVDYRRARFAEALRERLSN